MARIIYAWEIGGDYGHISGFMPLALELRKRGHEVIFVIRDLSNAEVVISKYKYQVFQAPIWNAEIKGLPNPPMSYSEIILRFGFINKTALSTLNRAWLALFALIKPDLIIADHSPVALFAARAIGLPRALYGTGFYSPPHVSPMPNMRPWTDLPQARLEGADQHVISVMNSLLIDMQSKALPLIGVADLFKVDVDLLCTFSEMDHYPQRQNATYWGPSFNVTQGKILSWQGIHHKNSQVNKRIFVYIKSQYQGYEKILSSLKSSGAEVLIFSPGISKKIIHDYQNDNMRFVLEPIQLASILPECDLAICHAGHGTIGACLLAGVPLLLLPMQLEQFLASLRIQQLGAAEIVNSESKEPIDFDLLIASMLNNQSYRQNAMAFAKRYSNFHQPNQIKGIATAIDNIIKKN